MAAPSTLYVVVSQVWDDVDSVAGIREPEIYADKEAANKAGRKLMGRYAKLLNPLGDPEEYSSTHQIDSEGLYRGRLDGGANGHIAAELAIYAVSLNQPSRRMTTKRPLNRGDDGYNDEIKKEEYTKGFFKDEDDDGNQEDGNEDRDGEDEEEEKDEDDKPSPQAKRSTKAQRKQPLSKTKPGPRTLRKRIPRGIPNCLDGVKLLFTGTFETMDRTMSIATAKKYGAEVITKLEDTDYIVTGVRIGPKKAQIINELELETINEEEFFDILENGLSKEKRMRMANKRLADEAEAPEEEEDKPKAPVGRKRARR